MKSTTIALIASMGLGVWILRADAIGSEPTAADQVNDKPVETTTAATDDAKAKEFKPPPGFKTKKRGKHVLYCIQDSTVGTRFKTEKCYDEAQMRDYIVAQEENKRDVDRVRAVCQNICVCGQPEAC